MEPVREPLIGLPKAWTPGTEGPVRGELMRVEIEDEEDFERYRGLLEGKILLLDAPRSLVDQREPDLELYDAVELEELEDFEIPDDRGGDWRERYRKRWELRKKTTTRRPRTSCYPGSRCRGTTGRRPPVTPPAAWRSRG